MLSLFGESVVERYGDVDVVRHRAATAPRRERLRRAAELLEELGHPGVVTLIDLQDDDTSTVLRTRLVAGDALADSSPTGVDELAGIAAHLAQTVAEMHRIGQTHGELRAEHVIVTPDGRPVLCGFGSGQRRVDAPERWATACVQDVAALGSLIERLAEQTEPAARRGAARRHRRALAAIRTVCHRALDDPNLTASELAESFAAVPGACLPAAPADGPRAPRPDPVRAAGISRTAEADVVTIDLTVPQPAGGTLPALGDGTQVLGDRTQASPGDGTQDEAEDVAPAGDGELADDAEVELVSLDVAFAPIHLPERIDRSRRRRTATRARDRGRFAALGAVAAIVLGGVLTSVGVSHLARTDPTRTETRAASPALASVLDAPRPLGACTASSEPRATLEGRTLTAGGNRYEVGRDGDVVRLGDWDGDGIATPALLRPSSGAVFLFDAWPSAETPLRAAPTTQVPGAVDAVCASDASGDQLVVITDSGRHVPVHVPSARGPRP